MEVHLDKFENRQEVMSHVRIIGIDHATTYHPQLDSSLTQRHRASFVPARAQKNPHVLKPPEEYYSKIK